MSARSPSGPGAPPTEWGALAALAILAVWTFGAMRGEGNFWLLSPVILVTHEAGHPIFAILGPFFRVMGGTLMQLLVPAVFMASLYVRGRQAEAVLASFWLVASLDGVSRYAQDAIDQDLPLIHTGMSAREEIETYGETEHDWINVLDMLHLPVSLAHGISLFAGFCAWALWLAAIVAGLYACHLRPTIAFDAGPARKKPGGPPKGPARR